LIPLPDAEPEHPDAHDFINLVFSLDGVALSEFTLV